MFFSKKKDIENADQEHILELAELRVKNIELKKEVDNLAKFREYIDNPYSFLRYFYPNIGLDKLDIRTKKDGTIEALSFPEEWQMDREAMRAHVSAIATIWHNEAFQKELDFLAKEIQKEKIVSDDNDKGKLLLQLLVFLSGFKRRFSELAQMKETNFPDKAEIIRKN